MPAIPTTQNYSVYVGPPGIATMSAGSIQWRYETTGTLPTTGTNLDLSLGNQQNARLTFNASSGEGLRLQLNDLNAVNIGTVTALIKAPSGATVSGLANVDGGTNTLWLQTGALTETGTYTVTLAPSGGARNLRLRLRRQGIFALTSGGTPTAMSTSATLTEARLTFTGSVGANLGLALSAITPAASAANPVTVEVYYQDAPLPITSTTLTGTSGGALNLEALASAGEYRVLVRPPP
ncbi:MAG: hypothetical protein HC933_21980 [Pleurocapsa sp. SU_196_0]|nr:hypothetical protein [Pleurocapsa sp. SU_196_0]